VRAILRDVHLIITQSDREAIAALADELVGKGLALVDSIYHSATQQNGETTDNEMMEKQNQFVVALQKAIQAITAAAKRQIEYSAALMYVFAFFHTKIKHSSFQSII